VRFAAREPFLRTDVKPKLLFPDGWDAAAVVSTNDQYGAVLAATVARELGLGGTDPVARSRADRDWLAALSGRLAPDVHQAGRKPRARSQAARQLPVYAIVNLGGASREDLELRFADVRRHVRFDATRRDHGMVMPTVNSAALPPSRTNSPQ
jgi:hypothetical protein